MSGPVRIGMAKAVSRSPRATREPQTPARDASAAPRHGGARSVGVGLAVPPPELSPDRVVCGQIPAP